MSRMDIIPQLMAVFQQYGYEGASLARFSEATGLQRGSLYYYFPRGKEEMAEAVLDHTIQMMDEFLLAPLRSEIAPIDRINGMNKNVDVFYQQGQRDCLFALFSTGEARRLFQDRVQKALNLWINELTIVLIDAGITNISAQQRAEEAVTMIQGSLFLTRGLKNTEIFRRTLSNMPENLLRPE
jgi:TetR/AcrR family transcriptional regulator, lmrAB and yxaGH operons repressor